MNVLDLTDEQLEQLFDSEDTELQEKVFLATQHPYYAFSPRPDDPDEYEEQSSFCEAGYHFDYDRGHYVYDDPAIRFKICLGGTGSGKTIGAAFKVAQHVLEMRPPEPDTAFWIISHTMEQVGNVCWKEKLSRLIPDNEIYDIAYTSQRKGWPSAVMLKHPDDFSKIGWRLQFKSYEQGFSSFVGASIGGYWLNEEVPYSLVHEVQGRTRVYDSPGWADFTPLECRDPEWPEKYNEPPSDWRFYHLNAKHNFYNAPDWYESQRAHWPEDMVEVRTIGKFTSLQGAVFKEFRRHIHVIDWDQFHAITKKRFIPRDWKKLRGIDFGFNNPFCCLWVAKDHDGVYYVYDEHYRGQAALADHAADIQRRDWDDSQPWYGNTYADHDKQDQFELRKLGIPTVSARKSINPGVELLRSLMLVGKNNKPKLYILKNCENLIKEIPGYRWAERRSTPNSKSPKDEPVDVDNHAIDALRYAIYSDHVDHLPMKGSGFKKKPNYGKRGVLMPGKR
jgi:PBSX family phage terminase large subunit